MQHVVEKVDMVGINNRNLKSFEVSLDQSIRLSGKLPANMITVAESGIQSVEDMLMLRDAGFDGFLVGETFMRAEDPGEECRVYTELLNE